MENYVQGICMEMCPLEEILIREKENLLHVLEMVPGTEKSKSPKADRSLMVKSYSRSAAGKTVNKAENLRPPKILLNTVSYLLFDVINTDKLPWHGVYDFINDRLMAVRQDMVIQNISKSESITILQPIIRFYSYAAYKLCNESLCNFDPVLNNRHLQECLKKLLYIYNASDKFVLNHDEHQKPNICHDYLIECRPEFEALYVIFNLGNEEALRRALNLPQKYKTKIVTEAIELSVCYKYGNFVRLCRLMKNLPTLLSAVASLFLPEIRRRAFRVMSTAYNSKNLKFPASTLQEILLYGTIGELLQDTKHYGIKDDNQYIFFSRENFNATRNIVPLRHEAFVENKFSNEDIYYILFGI